MINVSGGVTCIGRVGNINPADLASASSDEERQAMINAGSRGSSTWRSHDPTSGSWMQDRLRKLSAQKPWLWGKHAGAFVGRIDGAYTDYWPGALP